MSSTSELKKVKLNITNIKSVLVDGKKSVDEKKKEREDFLTKLEEDRKQRKEEKGLEKPIDPKKKPDLKSPVKSSRGLMDRIFTFVGAIVGGMIVKALPEIIDAFKKIYEKVKPFFDGIVEFLSPVFTSIGNLFKSEDSYESEKEKVNEDIDKAQLASNDIDDQVGELDKASDEIIRENKGLAANSDALGGEEIELSKDRETKDDENDDKNEVNNDDSNKVESNENITVENLGPSSASVVTKMVDGKEVVVTDMDESLKIQNDARNMLKNAVNGDGEKVVSSTEISGATNIIVPPVMPVKEDYPRTKQGRRSFRNAYKQYVIEMNEYNETQQNLVKPSENNKNGLKALNTTGGLTNANGSGSNTIIVQRQIVEVPIKIPVNV